ncbi:MAG: hypothetical protein AMXMBFR81_20810 [Chthonomonas sp.]
MGVPVRVLRRWMREGLIVVQSNDSKDRRKDLEQRVLVSRIDELRSEIGTLHSVVVAQQAQIQTLTETVAASAGQEQKMFEELTTSPSPSDEKPSGSPLWSKLARSLNP